MSKADILVIGSANTDITVRFAANAGLPKPRRRHRFGPLMRSMMRQFLELCRQEKKWLLIPLGVVVLLLLAAALLMASSSGIAWAIYR